MTTEKKDVQVNAMQTTQKTDLDRVIYHVLRQQKPKDLRPFDELWRDAQVRAKRKPHFDRWKPLYTPLSLAGLIFICSLVVIPHLSSDQSTGTQDPLLIELFDDSHSDLQDPLYWLDEYEWTAAELD